MDDIRKRVDDLLSPRMNRLDLAFSAVVRSVHQECHSVGLTDYRCYEFARDRAVEDVTGRVYMVRDAVRQVVTDARLQLSDKEIASLFDQLCPSLSDLKTNIYKAYSSLGIPIGGGFESDVANAFGWALEESRAELINLATLPPSSLSQVSGNPTVFISCGQVTEEERALGKALSKMVDDRTTCTGYFAQNEQTLRGVSDNILRALNGSIGFVAVMHYRGVVSGLEQGESYIRGSLWVEQEIAMAAFIEQVLNRNFAVAVYIQKGIRREGLRQQLLMNETEFDTEEEVLADFDRRLVSGTFAIPNAKR